MPEINKTPDFPHRVVFAPPAVEAAIGELAQRVSAYVADRGYDHVHIIPLLQGALIFAGRLIPALTFPATMSIEGVVTSKFRRANQPEALRVDEFQLDLPQNAAILILDDVYDTGETLCGVLARCATFAPTFAAVLFDKAVPNKSVPACPVFAGLDAPNEWLVGYGMDDDGAYRELNHVVSKL
ncbi:MAG: phosphoribosyltransferase family protein [Pseudomonadota bacterium]